MGRGAKGWDRGRGGRKDWEGGIEERKRGRRRKERRGGEEREKEGGRDDRPQISKRGCAYALSRS